jgi:hypothetical protein
MIVARISHDPHYRHALILCGDGARGKEGEQGEIPSN